LEEKVRGGGAVPAAAAPRFPSWEAVFGEATLSNRRRIMVKQLSIDNRSAFDVLALVAGLGLAFSPWYLGFAAETAAAWNAGLVGAAVAVIAVIALFAFHQAEEWINGVLGLWSVISPWALGFSAISPAATAHVVAGILVLGAAAANLWFDTKRPYSTA
jgi:hypothetical protein